MDAEIKRGFDLISNTEFEISLGMKFDVQSFLEDKIFIKKHTFNTNNNKYELEVFLASQSIQSRTTFIDNFISYVKYSYFNLFFINKYNNRWEVDYYTISNNESAAKFKITIF
ncbi:hypothetical protein [Enterococcus sp. LJL51]|uniref:hypothetical protein n=1 Tax=Enterococcus sp. LJL51 TaxID=3416656 RepID=UPI003CEA8043